jgi:phospholipid/cholesterol/gamma-HCH transport system permease protein
VTSPRLRTETSDYPVAGRASLKILRASAKIGGGFLGGIGERVIFIKRIIRGFSEVRTWAPLTLPQMRALGVDSVPLTAMVAAFIGGVIAMQVRYQLFPGISLSVVGLSVRQMIILELGPLLTGLVLAGRVGARMTAEIGTMRVTEQIDALETLAYDPVAYLIVPRIIAGTLMLPMLVVIANVVGIASGFITAVFAAGVSVADFRDGLRLGFGPFQLWYSLIKGTMFGTAIAFFCTYEGFKTEAGAEGVGRSTARAVVYTSVAILILDAVTAFILAPYLQA